MFLNDLNLKQFESDVMKIFNYSFQSHCAIKNIDGSVEDQMVG